MTLPVERTRAIVHTEKFLHDLVTDKSQEVSNEIRERARSLLRHFPTEFDLELAYDIATKSFPGDIVAFPIGETPGMLRRTKISVECKNLLKSGDVDEIIHFFMSLVKDIGPGVDLFPSLLKVVTRALVELRDGGHMELSSGILVANSHFKILSDLVKDSRLSDEARKECSEYIGSLNGDTDGAKQADHLLRGFRGFVLATRHLNGV